MANDKFDLSDLCASILLHSVQKGRGEFHVNKYRGNYDITISGTGVGFPGLYEESSKRAENIEAVEQLLDMGLIQESAEDMYELTASGHRYVTEVISQSKKLAKSDEKSKSEIEQLESTKNDTNKPTQNN